MILYRLLFAFFIFTSWAIYSDPNEDLLLSIKSNNLQKIKDSISQGADPNTKDESGLTAFLISVSKGNKQIIQYFLNLSIDFNSVDSNGNNALHYLAKKSDVSLIESLLEKGLRINDVNLAGQTPIHIAISSKQVKNLTVMLKAKPDLNAKDSSGNSPLLLAYKNKLMPTFDELLKEGAAPDITDNDGNTLLHIMLAENNIKAAKSILNQVPTLLNVPNNLGKTPLIYTLEKNKETAFAFLIEQNADVKVLDSSKSSVLHYLAKSKYPKFIKQVIVKGADLNQRNQDGDTAILVSVKDSNVLTFKELMANGADNSTKSLDGKPILIIAHEFLLKAITANKTKMFIEIINQGANVNITTASNKSLLTEYIEKGNAEIVTALLKNGADKKVLDKDGNNLLHIACMIGKEEVVKVLLDNGFDLKEKGVNGNTPLIFSAQGGFSQLVSFLLNRGAVVNEMNSRDETALLIAVGRQDLKTIKELLRAKANIELTNNVGNSVLIESAKSESGNLKNTIEVISLLLKNGADINLQNSFGNSALSYAINRKNYRLTEFLLKEGANPNLVDLSGNNAVHKLTFTAVYDRIKNKELEDFIHILFNYKTDMNSFNNEGLNPLMIATKSDKEKDDVACLQIIRKLLDLNTDLLLKNEKGKSALDYIKNSNEKEIQSIANRYVNSNRIDNEFNISLPNSSEADKSKKLQISKSGIIYHLIESNGKSILSKYSNTGEPISTLKLESIEDFLVDQKENIFLLGITFDKMKDVTDNKCKPNESKIISVKKLNENGEEIWVKYFSEKGACLNTNAISIVNDYENNIYLGMNFGTKSFQIAKLSQEGEILWKEKTQESFNNIQVSDDRIYLVGKKINSIQLDGKKPINLKLGNSEEVMANFYDKLSDSFFATGKTILSPKTEVLFFSKFNKAGKLVWKKYFYSAKEISLAGISSDTEGNIFVHGTTTIDFHSQKNMGGKDGFVFKFDSNGNRLWTEFIGSNADDVINGISFDEKNRPLIHGTTESSIGKNQNLGLTDIFLIRLNK